MHMHNIWGWDCAGHQPQIWCSCLWLCFFLCAGRKNDEYLYCGIPTGYYRVPRSSISSTHCRSGHAKRICLSHNDTSLIKMISFCTKSISVWAKGLLVAPNREGIPNRWPFWIPFDTDGFWNIVLAQTEQVFEPLRNHFGQTEFV